MWTGSDLDVFSFATRRRIYGYYNGSTPTSMPYPGHEEDEKKELSPPQYTPPPPPSLHLGDDYELHSVRTNGECFFDCIHMILRSIGRHESSEFLRSVVAFTVLADTDKVTNETLQCWLIIAKEAKRERDFDLLKDYAHVAAVAEAEWPLTQKERKKIYEAMLNPTRYWADEHAVRIIEDRLLIRILILQHTVEGELFIHHPVDHSSNPHYVANHYVLLYLSHKHYQPVSYKGKFLFRKEEIPEKIVELMSKSKK
jgi:hypothetical protein